jgi:hypothetical protein
MRENFADTVASSREVSPSNSLLADPRDCFPASRHPIGLAHPSRPRDDDDDQTFPIQTAEEDSAIPIGTRDHGRRQ